MYIIKTDDKLLYSPELIDQGYKVLSPRLQPEVNMAGSLSFVLPPGNVMYEAIQKMKSIITVEQDGEIIFRGRMSEEATDFYRQKEVYCEGDLSFLLDSMQTPFTFTGKAAALLAMLIAKHNEQVDEEKRFTLGIVTAVDDEDSVDYAVTNYANTSSTLQALLLDVFGGYLRTRHEDGKHYLDYIDAFNSECTQKIEFGVNLLDIDSQVGAQDIFTVLIPLGALQDDGTQLTIESVNGGISHIENSAGVAKYGRIWKTYTWDQVTDPAQLLALGKAYAQSATLNETLTLQAVDLHLLNVDTDKIRLGDAVQLLSAPHGLDRKSICAAMDIDLEDASKSTYTFGLQKQTMADQAVSTANQIQRINNSINDQHLHIKETRNAVNVNIEAINLIGHKLAQVELDIDAAESAIEAKANQSSVDILGTRLTNAELRIDGAESAITAKADQTAVDDVATRVTSAEANIDGLNGQITMLATKEEVTEVSTTLNQVSADLDTAKAAIEMKASTDTVDAMGKRLSSAELRISGAESKIEAKADLILLDGYVKMSDFEAVEGWAKEFAGESISASSIVGGYGDFDELVCGQFNGYTPKWTGGTVLTGIGTINQSKRYLKLALADGGSVELDIVTNVDISPSTAYINYLGRE